MQDAISSYITHKTKKQKKLSELQQLICKFMMLLICLIT